MTDSVNARLVAIKQRIGALADEYEALLVLTIGIAEAYKARTGRDLDPNEQIPAEDETTARRKSLQAMPKAGA